MSGECNREWFTPNQSRYPGHPGMWDQRESDCPQHGTGAPYYRDEYYDDRWRVAVNALDGMGYQCLTDGDLVEIGVALRTAVAVWETEATARLLTIETTTEENSNG